MNFKINKITSIIFFLFCVTSQQSIHSIGRNEGGKCKYCQEYKKSLYAHEKHHCKKNPNRVPRKQSKGGYCTWCEEYKKALYHHEKHCYNNPNKVSRKKTNQGGICQHCKEHKGNLQSHKRYCGEKNKKIKKRKIKKNGNCPWCKKYKKQLKIHENRCNENPYGIIKKRKKRSSTFRKKSDHFNKKKALGVLQKKKVFLSNSRSTPMIKEIIKKSQLKQKLSLLAKEKKAKEKQKDFLDFELETLPDASTFVDFDPIPDIKDFQILPFGEENEIIKSMGFSQDSKRK